jgi:hypothetical protein
VTGGTPGERAGRGDDREQHDEQASILHAIRPPPAPRRNRPPR